MSDDENLPEPGTGRDRPDPEGRAHHRCRGGRRGARARRRRPPPCTRGAPPGRPSRVARRPTRPSPCSGSRCRHRRATSRPPSCPTGPSRPPGSSPPSAARSSTTTRAKRTGPASPHAPAGATSATSGATTRTCGPSAATTPGSAPSTPTAPTPTTSSPSTTSTPRRPAARSSTTPAAPRRRALRLRRRSGVTDEVGYDDAGWVEPDPSGEDARASRGPRKIVVGGGRVTPGTRAGGRGRPHRRAGVGGDRNIGQAAVVGVGFLVVAAVLFFLGPATAAILVVGRRDLRRRRAVHQAARDRLPAGRAARHRGLRRHGHRGVPPGRGRHPGGAGARARRSPCSGSCSAPGRARRRSTSA